jgi:hypothetical protein
MECRYQRGVRQLPKSDVTDVTQVLHKCYRCYTGVATATSSTAPSDTGCEHNGAGDGSRGIRGLWALQYLEPIQTGQSVAHGCSAAHAVASKAPSAQRAAQHIPC